MGTARRARIACIVVSATLGACATGASPDARVRGWEYDASPGEDASRPDAGGSIDAGRDAGAFDGGPRDAGRADAGPPDAGPLCVAESCNGLDDDCDGSIDETAACPCDVVGYGGRAYMFCGGTQTWAAARARCVGYGYSLAVIDTAAEDAFVYGEMASRSFADTWIGLNDLFTEGSWVWLDGLPVTYSHWDAGEPNDGGSSGEDCGVIMTASGRESEWDDRGCGQSRPYVCEAPVP